MANPRFTYLRQLMGNDWVDTNVFGENPQHLLGRWQKNNEANPWVPYVEELTKALLTNKNIQLDTATLAQKVDADFESTLAEMEVAVFLSAQGLSIVVEPTAPERGPDLRADWNDTSYFIEVRAVGDSEEDDRFNSISREIFTKLNAVASSYTAMITVGDEYTPASQPLRKATDALLSGLEILKTENWKRATLYYSTSGTLMSPHGDYTGSSAGSSAALKTKHQSIVEAADFVVRFRNVGEERTKTAASMSREFKRQLEPDKTHERLKKILNKKRAQLPKESKGIIVLDGSELFMLNDFSIEAALYGDLVVRLTAPTIPGGPIGEPTMHRNGRGLFRLTSRVSAVVIHRRRVEGDQIRNDWQVFPTNRANSDTLRLTLAELKRFGELGDRAHLSAESTPNEGDEDAEPGQPLELETK
jgi:Holliday junction resolvase-like predicted endonuclease